MLKYLVNKIFNSNKKDSEKKSSNIAVNIKEKSIKLAEFINKNSTLVKQEIYKIREKTKDLRSTNYDLGFQHLEAGRITDAIIRFRIVKKMWPDLYEAYYHLAYCLVLKNKLNQAREVLEELLAKKPDFNPIAQELLDYINKITSDAE